MGQREIIARFEVQPGLAVAVEDSHNILLVLTTPDGTQELARSDALSDIDQLHLCLLAARGRVMAEEENAREQRAAELSRKMTARRTQ